MQLDLFADCRDVILRNEAIEALQQRDPARCAEARAALAEAFPDDGHLGALAQLEIALAEAEGPPFAEHTLLAAALEAVHQRTDAAARQVFGASAFEAWLVPIWRSFAQRSAALSFSSAAAELHAAPLWLRAGDPCAAMAAVQGIASWRRIPAPLGWMAEARASAQGLDAAWPLLVELAWMAPDRFGRVAAGIADPRLARLRQRFDAVFEGSGESTDLAWFPAWVLTERSDLWRRLGEAQSSTHTAPEQAMRLLVELIGLEHQGRHHDIVERRRRLKGLHGFIYAAYMKLR